MIYKFNLISDEVNDFKLEIQIDSDDTFMKLRNTILDAAGYTKDQMDSFIICDDDWNKKNEVTQTDMGTDSDEDLWLMDKTKISELVEDDGQRLMFVFDYLTNRAFFMELKEIIYCKDLDEPVCTRKIGHAPKQAVNLDDFDAQIDALAKNAATNKGGDEFYDEFYGSDEFNDDEFDPDGFEVE